MECRLPQGRRGLKCYVVVIVCALAGSPPAREAWIEIRRAPSCTAPVRPSPPAREAWIEIMMAKVFIVIMESRLPQGRRGLKSHNGILIPILEGRLPQGRRGLKSPESVLPSCPH